MTTQNTPALSNFDQLWLTEAIRLREEHAGLLEDAEANRQARTRASDLAGQIQHRALWLARRDGQLAALQHWHQGARLAALVLVVVALLAGVGMGMTALGDSLQPVNVFWALGSLLGLNLLMLALWLVGLLSGGRTGALMGRIWFWLSEHLARDAHTLQLIPALLAVLHQRRLTRWLLGCGTHGLWLLAMSSALLTLLLLMATHRYGFVWETTILNEQAFIQLTQGLGQLPHWLLGIAIPTEEQIRASGVLQGDLENTRQVWANWLSGVMLVYGLGPRLLLLLFCALRWRRGRGQLQLDLGHSTYQVLRQRLQPRSTSLGITDPEPKVMPSVGRVVPPPSPLPQGGPTLVAIELDDRRDWPPSLSEHIHDAGVIDDRQQRRQLLEQLTQTPAERLLIACDPRRSPDRGTLNLLGELSRCASATRIWLLPAPSEEPLDADRLEDWHDALQQLALTQATTAPLHWLESGDD